MQLSKIYENNIEHVVIQEGIGDFIKEIKQIAAEIGAQASTLKKAAKKTASKASPEDEKKGIAIVKSIMGAVKEVVEMAYEEHGVSIAAVKRVIKDLRSRDFISELGLEPTEGGSSVEAINDWLDALEEYVIAEAGVKDIAKGFTRGAMVPVKKWFKRVLIAIGIGIVLVAFFSAPALLATFPVAVAVAHSAMEIPMAMQTGLHGAYKAYKGESGDLTKMEKIKRLRGKLINLTEDNLLSDHAAVRSIIKGLAKAIKYGADWDDPLSRDVPVEKQDIDVYLGKHDVTGKYPLVGGNMERGEEELGPVHYSKVLLKLIEKNKKKLEDASNLDLPAVVGVLTEISRLLG